MQNRRGFYLRLGWRSQAIVSNDDDFFFQLSPKSEKKFIGEMVRCGDGFQGRGGGMFESSIMKLPSLVFPEALPETLSFKNRLYPVCLLLLMWGAVSIPQ